MAEKWDARGEAFYAGGDGWGFDTANYCKTPDEAQQAHERAKTIRDAVGSLLSGSGVWADVKIIREAVSDRDELDAQVAIKQDAPGAGERTAQKDDMPLEVVAGYEIKQRVEFSDKEGVVLAHSPTAPDPYVTWRYIDRDGERDYYSGLYRKTEESALREFNNIAETNSPGAVLHNSPPEAPAPEPTMSTFPLYKNGIDHAVDHGETKVYEQSRQFNYKCRDTIDKAITDNQKSIEGAPAGVSAYDIKAAVWSVLAECGRERAEWVLAANINAAAAVNDGRISQENGEWAANIGAPKAHDYHIQAHKTVLDVFARRFRESEKEKPPMSFVSAQAQKRMKEADAQKSGADMNLQGQKFNPQEL
jgi:hypothetical protein